MRNAKRIYCNNADVRSSGIAAFIGAKAAPSGRQGERDTGVADMQLRWNSSSDTGVDAQFSLVKSNMSRRD
jgi:hypothetical protein